MNDPKTEVTYRVASDIDTWINTFLNDRKARSLSKGTDKFYRTKLDKFTQYCDGLAVRRLDQVDAQLIRSFLLFLTEEGHNPGGIHAYYRATKALIRFWIAEDEPEGYRDPFKLVKSPHRPKELLNPASKETVLKMLDTCGRDWIGIRDRAILLTLTNTGVRAAELLDMNIGDVDMVTGQVLVRKGKGNKQRIVYLREARKALRTWLKARRDVDTPAIFTSRFGVRLGYDGLRAIVNKRAKLAGVEAPTLHSFRRGFVLALINSGVDLFTIQQLTGHESLEALSHYVKLSKDDVAAIYRRVSQVNEWFKMR